VIAAVDDEARLIVDMFAFAFADVVDGTNCKVTSAVTKLPNKMVSTVKLGPDIRFMVDDILQRCTPIAGKDKNSE
jgi:hypothetical protein